MGPTPQKDDLSRQQMSQGVRLVDSLREVACFGAAASSQHAEVIHQCLRARRSGLDGQGCQRCQTNKKKHRKPS